MKSKKIIIISLAIFLSMTAFSHAAEPTHFTGIKFTPTSCNYAGKVNINGTSAIDGADEVGVFVYDEANRTILVGACVMGDVVEGHYFVTIYGDDPSTPEKDGAKENDFLIFKIWDKSEDKTYTISSCSMVFVSDNILTQPSVPPTWVDKATFGLLNLSNAIICGDINQDSQINLTDAILGLQIISGIPPLVNVYKESDVNHDGRIGLEEIVYVLQTVAKLN